MSTPPKLKIASQRVASDSFSEARSVQGADTAPHRERVSAVWHVMWGEGMSAHAVTLLLVMTITKLALASLWGWTADIHQTYEQAIAWLANRDLLDPQSTAGNPAFFPWGHYVIAATCLRVSQFTGMAFVFAIKVPAILADLGVSLLLRVMPQGGNRIAVLYMLNPVTLLLSVYHGQLHTVAMALAVWSLWLGQQKRFRFASFILGLSASIRQHFAALIVPLAIKAGKRQWLVVLCLACLPVFLDPALLRSAHPGRFLAPTWTYGSWGYTMVLAQGPRVLSVMGLSQLGLAVDGLNRTLHDAGFMFYWVWGILFALWTWRRPNTDVWHAALFFLVGFYAISPGFGVQWLVWAVPFWLLVNRREAIGYSALAGSFLAGSYWQWSLNAKYEVSSITANLQLLSRTDLIGVLLVGLVGVLTWAYCVRASWRLVWG